MQNNNDKRIYTRISHCKRQKLIELLTVKNYTIARAARNLSINPETARLIFKKYKETGQFYTTRFLKTKDIVNSQHMGLVNEEIKEYEQNLPISPSSTIAETIIDWPSTHLTQPASYVYYYWPYIPSCMDYFV